MMDCMDLCVMMPAGMFLKRPFNLTTIHSTESSRSAIPCQALLSEMIYFGGMTMEVSSLLTERIDFHGKTEGDHQILEPWKNA